MDRHLISEDTITAQITPSGRGGISVVRVSGPETRRIVTELVVRGGEVLEQPRRAVMSAISDLAAGNVLDQGIVTFFAGRESFTGEDSAEFSLHGSPFIVSRLLENVTALGARLAEPGEFSKRAFLNGKIDLSQAEAIADLIEAETAGQARVAQEQLSGKLSGAISKLGDPLRDLVAEIEAHIDFPEEDIDPLTRDAWTRVIATVNGTIATYLASFRTGKIYREGAQVALVGLPNAGKSSLLNALVGEDRAIVTPQAGTTRDAIEERISLDGLYLRLWDTAGISVADDHTHLPGEIEKLGIERSWKRLELAELTLFVFDATRDFFEQEALLAQISSRTPVVLLVANKTDLLSENELHALRRHLLRKPFPSVFISALKLQGLEQLHARIKENLLGEARQQEAVLVTTKRHFDALSAANSALSAASAAVNNSVPAEFVALELRSALGFLNDIIGVTHTEDILGRIFSKFCIGK